MMSTPMGPTVLLTGVSGFLGSHLLRALHAAGIPVVAMKRSSSDTARIADLIAKVPVYDFDTVPLREVFERHSIDTVIHTATCYGRYGESAGQVVDANVLVPIRILELAHEFKVSTFLNTDTYYRTDTRFPAAMDYYALSKTHFREYGQRFARRSALRFVNVQLHQMYGPHDNPIKFIPTLIRRLLAGERSIALTTGVQRRDFVYVDDVVAAFLTLFGKRASLDAPFSHFEIGCGKAEVLRDVVELVRDLCDSDAELAFGTFPHMEDELMHAEADIAQIVKYGWMQTISLREGLRRTIEASRAAGT